MDSLQCWSPFLRALSVTPLWFRTVGTVVWRCDVQPPSSQEIRASLATMRVVPEHQSHSKAG